MGGNLDCLVVVTHYECLPSGLLSALYISWRPGHYIMVLVTRVLDTWVLKSRLLYVKQHSSYPLGFLVEMRVVFKLPSHVLLFWLRILNFSFLLDIIYLVHRFMRLGCFCFCFWSFSHEIPPDHSFPSLYFSQFLPCLFSPWEPLLFLFFFSKYLPVISTEHGITRYNKTMHNPLYQGWTRKPYRGERAPERSKRVRDSPLLR